MSGRYFLDTNVVVYSFDSRAPGKQSRARELIETALQTHKGLISWQVVQEFLSVALRKFERPMTPDQCREYHDVVLEPLCEVLPSGELYRQALRVHQDTGFSLYDSLIVAAAAGAGCRTLYTEDLQDGRALNGLTIVNPFR